MKNITVLGIACVDIIVSGYSKMPKLGQLEFTDTMKLHTGGCALNCSIDLSEIGIDHALIVPVGNDVFGSFIKNTLAEYNINQENIITVKDTATSSSVVLIDKNGERSFLHNPGANSVFDYKNIDLRIVEKTDILFVGGALLMPNFDGKQMSKLLQYAKSKGVYTILDIGWDPTGKWMDILEPVLKYVDLFVPSIDEALKLAETNDLIEMNKVFMSKGVKNTIIKLGGDGAAYFDGDELIKIPAISVEKAIDTTGAGDSFMSGILTGLSLNWNIEESIKLANVVGSCCVTEFGASGGIKNLEQTIKMKERHYE